ncbi:hypothetical protein AVEN_181324-1 [Araneus ventricosus]|uniref:Uncharacterized protein n=1 Tax=Araneus ventricosus TaxID=182803 RepID=A0A4Y2E127_ARAVE|nr:hypothetical protein AVEN_181324-1 [Araneus ventricosus]
MKYLLKRVSGKAYLSHEKMMTEHCEAIINSRPLTYNSENDTDFNPISTYMFIQDIRECADSDLYVAGHNIQNKRSKYRIAVQEDLRDQFWSEEARG